MTLFRFALPALLVIPVIIFIFDWVDKRGKKLNEIIDSRKDLIYNSDGTFKERYVTNEKRYDYTL